MMKDVSADLDMATSQAAHTQSRYAPLFQT